MSAYMVNEDTLDLLASVTTWDRSGLFLYVKPGTLPPRSELVSAPAGESIEYTAEHRAFIKQELRLENIASLWARYPKDGGEMAGEGETFRAICSDQATIAEALGALRCYEYQACESNEWEMSYAYALCQAIRRQLCALMSEGHWEYERPKGQAERVSLMDMLGGN